MPIVVAVVAVPALAWTAYAFVSDDHPSTARPSDSSRQSVVTPEPTSTSFEEGRQTRQVLDDCAARAAAADAVVAEAAIGVGHWDEHVQARTDLLAGRNTEADTKAIWKRTRLAGPGDLERFNAAVTAYNAAPPCAGADPRTAPADLRAILDACTTRTAQGEAATAAAAAAIGDWQSHLNAMAAHAHGDMTAAQAQDQWVEAWEQAPTNIEAFNDARNALQQAPACTGAGA